jgi:UDP-N-acetylglucosamine acyltransferase
VFWTSRKTAELSFRYENVSVHPTAEIGDDVEIGPFSVIGPNCRVGDGCRLHSQVTLVANTVLGKENEIFAGAVLGATPQDKKYEGETSWLLIGDNNTIRECVTVHAGTRLGGGKTIVGSRNLLMAGCHVAHDCVLEDDITIANNVLLGGHVYVESFATFGGMAAVHHFVTVGRHAFIGGMSRVNQDVPPFMLLEGNPSRVRMVNKIGLRRRSISVAAQEALKEAHRLLYRSGVPRRESMAELEARLGDVEEVRYLLAFLRRTERGQKGRARQP